MNDVYAAISELLDQSPVLNEDIVVVKGVLSIVEKDPCFGKKLLRGIHEKCPVISSILIIKIIRDYCTHEYGTLPVLLHQHTSLPLYRKIYSSFVTQSNTPSETTAATTSRLLELFSDGNKGFGDVIDSVLSTVVVMDMTKKEGNSGNDA